MKNINQTLDEFKFSGCIEADGGVTLDNVGSCFTDGCRAFVGGSAIIGQQDVRGIIREFRNHILEARRKQLLVKANNLGGSELVKKWIGLHKIGQKHEQISKMAREAGFI